MKLDGASKMEIEKVCLLNYQTSRRGQRSERLCGNERVRVNVTETGSYVKWR